jgi:hypothetical protein
MRRGKIKLETKRNCTGAKNVSVTCLVPDLDDSSIRRLYLTGYERRCVSDHSNRDNIARRRKRERTESLDYPFCAHSDQEELAPWKIEVSHARIRGKPYPGID